MSKPHFQPTVGIHDNRLEAMYRCSQIQPCTGSAPTTCWPHAVYLQARLGPYFLGSPEIFVRADLHGRARGHAQSNAGPVQFNCRPCAVKC